MQVTSQTKTYGQIAGWGAYLPPQVVSNDELEDRFGVKPGWIERRSGIRQRHIAGPNETTATMATEAGRAALARAGITAAEVDLVIVATSTPDHLAPPVSSLVQDSLAADGAPAMVLVTGCSGFVYGLCTAYQFIAAGTYRNILLIGAELISRFVDWNDASTCVLFGDGAGAVVVQATDQSCGMRGFVLGSDGSQAATIMLPEGAAAKPLDATTFAEGRHYLKMNGREVFRFASGVIGPACQAALAKAQLTYDDVDWIIPHQANLRIITAAARSMHLPIDRFIVNIDRYANVSAASIPLALAENLDAGRIALDQTLLLVAFGAGLTWGALVLQPQPATMPVTSGIGRRSRNAVAAQLEV